MYRCTKAASEKKTRIIMDESAAGENAEEGEFEQKELRREFTTRATVLRKDKVMLERTGSWQKSDGSSENVTWVS